MNTEEMHPDDALEEARYITAFLGASVSAFGAADEACRPNEDGWTGLLIITELLNDLLTRAGEEA
ncbi:MAG TPA: hypothetical protein H9774_12790 [Candidatus Desulfovibrio gallistercoris]|nr:hypothetical protein [Candidatus Desulfovibrio gallistercoris]